MRTFLADSIPLATALVVAFLLLECSHNPGRYHQQSGPVSGASSPAHRAELEVVRVDDTIDPFKGVSEAEIPVNENFTIMVEVSRVGSGKLVSTHFATVLPHHSETKEAATARLRKWLDHFVLPPGARFGFGDMGGLDPDPQKNPVARRSYILVGESLVLTDDIDDATTSINGSDPVQENDISVTLTTVGMKRFADLTRDWQHRRLVIVVNRVVRTAPVVGSVVDSGPLIFPVGLGEENTPALAARMARDLRGH
jgi:hypothetical protein